MIKNKIKKTRTKHFILLVLTMFILSLNSNIVFSLDKEKIMLIDIKENNIDQIKIISDNLYYTQVNEEIYDYEDYGHSEELIEYSYKIFDNKNISYKK